MSNKMKLTLYAVISALIVIVGIVLYAVLGFRSATDETRLEISYDAVVTITEKEDDLEKLCEEAISSKGLKFRSKTNAELLDSSSIGETGDKMIRYGFQKKVDMNVLREAADLIRERAQSEFSDADIYVTVHATEALQMSEAAWRGAIALAVSAIIALAYLAFRYGIASAVAGACAALCGGFVSFFVFAILQIPVYSYAPLLFAGLGTVFTLLFWILQSAKMKQSSRDESLSAEEAVLDGCRGARKMLLLLAISVAAVFLLFGAVATDGVRLFFLPALIPLGVALVAAMGFGPCVMIPLKKKIDSAKTARKYVGKKKADAEQ